MARIGERREDGCSKSPAGKFTSFTLLTVPIDQVLMQIKIEEALTFHGKLKGDPNKRSKDKYCRFHYDHDHDTADCYDLKQQIEALIRQGSCKGGITTTRSSKEACKTYLRMVHNVQLTGFIPKMAWIDNFIIEFSEEDVRRLHHPHDDALVVSIQVGDYNTHRVLVDNGNSADIPYYPTFQQMRIDRERLVSTNASLVGFGGTKVFPLGVVTLSVTVGDYPQ
ncbi:uncharacterized protein LOC112032569 [Quercus suber]|uniref:uncharacterized protein LOC112032569 n=1 Tax=Quercus suber TaxID=58331 RepID=UPI000CE1B9E3|nr:uncharacterized protein LOC112032569 [Quercus suber]